MSAPTRFSIDPLPGFRSPGVGLFVAQLDDQSRRLTEATRDISPGEIGWQSAPGMNTAGMLLTHIPLVEVYWGMIAFEGAETPDVRRVLGIGMDGDGLPLAADGAPPATLVDKPAAYFDDLAARARAYLKEGAASLAEADLEREIVRRRPDGTERIFTVRWVFYHLLEHFAGHFGQVLLIRHLYRTRSGERSTGA